jgi:hypothetical protein
MFLRELLVEKDSAEIALTNIKHDVDKLTHSTWGMNHMTPKRELLRIFIPLTQKIKAEQNKLRGDAGYGDVINEVSPDKLAILTISTIVKLCTPYVSTPITTDFVEIKMSEFSSNMG